MKKSTIMRAALLGALALAASPAMLAQKEVPASQISALVYGNNVVNLETNEATELHLSAYARYKFAVSSTDWLKASVSGDRIILSADENPTAASRTAVLTLRGNQGVSTSFTVNQPGWDIVSSAETSYNNMFVVPVRSKDACKNSAGKAQASDPLTKSYDGDLSTIYHSNWSGFDSSDATQWPILEYYFTAANAPETESVEIASITYCPRREGGENGRFGVVEIEIGTYGTGGDNLTWTPLSAEPLDFKMSASDTTVPIPENMQKGIRAIRFTVHSGAANSLSGGKCFASCAEMQFKRPVDTNNPDQLLFADAVFSKLKPGVTAEQVEAMTDPLYKTLAQKLISGEYDATNMVSTHNAIKDPLTLSREFQADGKCYDKTAGVTGVALTPGQYVIFASGIPEEKGTVELKLTYWHGHEQYKDENDNTVSWYCEENTYSLHNGLNLITVNTPSRRPDHRVEGDMMGLVYVNNFNDEAAAAGLGAEKAVTVHIVGALYNGVLTAYNTNAENQAILDNAVYPCIDLLGSRVHSVFQVNALKKYAAGQYVRYINYLDQLIIWEHRVLGLEKYNKVPENRTMTFVNYNYYMYQGGRGPTFMYDTQYRVCSPDNLINHDSDAVWGLSHEWGHQHQMSPYFRWVGMGEVTNNVFSAYNVIHTGYPIATDPGRYPRDKWQNWVDSRGVSHQAQVQKIFVDDNYNREITGPNESGETKTANSEDNIVMSCRTDAANAAKAGNAFYWSKNLKEFAMNQPKYPTKRFASNTATYDNADQNIVNPRSALNAIEAYSSNNGELVLGPYINLMFYFAENGYPDLWPDFFESLRQNDYEHGSSIEKGKTEVDKYELLTSIFNNNKAVGCDINKTEQFRQLFPNSCWVTEGYLPTTQTLSWDKNSGPAIMNCIRKLSRLCGYNLWSYFESYGVITVCALEQGDYGVQYYIMTDEMFDEFKADMDALEADGTLKPLTDEMRTALSNAKATEFPRVNIPNDRPILPSDN